MALVKQRFELLELLGQSKYTSVYKSYDKKHNQTCIVKFVTFKLFV